MQDTALLIVDVQNAVVDGAQRAARLDEVLANLNLAISKARQRGMPVLFVQHEDAELVPGTHGWALHPQLAREPGDEVFAKRYGDSFCDTRLEGWLSERGIAHLWIGGSATDFCIDSTVRGAVFRGYAVTVLGDAHTCTNRPALTGGQVIDHFNWVWGVMDATPQPLSVAQAAAL